MNDFCSLLSSPHRVQPVRHVWGDVGEEEGDAGLKVKALRMRDGVNPKPESSAQASSLPGNNTFLIEPVGQTQMRGDSIFISLPVFL